MAVAIWLMACVGDLALVAATIVLARSGAGLGIWILIALAWSSWRDAGGLDNWRPSVIRTYLKNTRRMGL
jgi:hypothetical protein